MQGFTRRLHCIAVSYNANSVGLPAKAFAIYSAFTTAALFRPCLFKMFEQPVAAPRNLQHAGVLLMVTHGWEIKAALANRFFSDFLNMGQ